MPASKIVCELLKYSMPQDKELVERGIESSESAIDRLIYELSHKGMIYGLTEDEVKIVEGG